MSNSLDQSIWSVSHPSWSSVKMSPNMLEPQLLYRQIKYREVNRSWFRSAGNFTVGRNYRPRVWNSDEVNVKYNFRTLPYIGGRDAATIYFFGNLPFSTPYCGNCMFPLMWNILGDPYRWVGLPPNEHVLCLLLSNLIFFTPTCCCQPPTCCLHNSKINHLGIRLS